MRPKKSPLFGVWGEGVCGGVWPFLPVTDEPIGWMTEWLPFKASILCYSDVSYII